MENNVEFFDVRGTEFYGLSELLTLMISEYKGELDEHLHSYKECGWCDFQRAEEVEKIINSCKLHLERKKFEESR